jgi:hypothetical protein
MYYVIIENDQMTGVLNYEPSLPDTATAISITDEQYNSITIENTHYFDLETRTVVSHPQEKIDLESQNKQQEIINAEKREFLNSSDWKILRHLREKTLSMDTTLSETEYLELEQLRNDAAKDIVKTNKYTGTSE